MAEAFQDWCECHEAASAKARRGADIDHRLLAPRVRDAVAVSEFADWQPAPNIRDAPELYELENRATDPTGVVLAEMRRLAPWAGRTLVDLGCGTGYWLPRYAGEARRVIGVEPDVNLLAAAKRRIAGLSNVEVRAGSAEHLPLESESADVVHARFAYFWGVGSENGVAEVMRVLRPAGSLVVVDNDHSEGEFAQLLLASDSGFAQRRQDDVDRWWTANGATKSSVVSSWQFASRADMEAVLANEFRDGAAGRWLAANPNRRSLSYGYAIFHLIKPA